MHQRTAGAFVVQLEAVLDHLRDYHVYVGERGQWIVDDLALLLGPQTSSLRLRLRQEMRSLAMRTS